MLKHDEGHGEGVSSANEDRTEFRNGSLLHHTPLYELVLEMMHNFCVFELHMNFYVACEMCYADLRQSNVNMSAVSHFCESKGI